ncbi:MAG: hypothetical protein J7M05_03620 [Anaerolineae bacterium]|nr:hypothetical protein [Anaerolineae bacterium]
MVDAVLHEQGHNPYQAYRTLEAFLPWVQRKDWQELLDTFARCVRITRDQPELYEVDPSLFVEPATKALYQAYKEAETRLRAERSIDTLFQVLEDLKPHIRRFFDDVLVMAEEEELRKNRLGLLQAIGNLTKGIVDLSVMEGF